MRSVEIGDFIVVLYESTNVLKVYEKTVFGRGSLLFTSNDKVIAYEKSLKEKGLNR